MEEKVIVDFAGVSRSKVWKVFGFWKKGKEICKDKAVCRLCMAEYTYVGNNTNLPSASVIQVLSLLSSDSPN